MARSYDKKDFWGNEYQEHEDGSRSYHKEDFWGDEYWEHEDGSRSYENEDFWDNKYLKHDNGTRSYEKEDFWGNGYQEHESGRRSYHKKDFWGNTYNEHESSGSSCFITTACVNHKGLTDNCEELTILRNFRDNFIKRLYNGNLFIRKYYEIAPKIVRDINISQHRDEIYNLLFLKIQNAISLIKLGKNEQAFQLYCEMFRKLTATRF